jgi:hypothetical protein
LKNQNPTVTLSDFRTISEWLWLECVTKAGI